jgi:hypothetical protein
VFTKSSRQRLHDVNEVSYCFPQVLHFAPQLAEIGVVRVRVRVARTPTASGT